MKGTVFSVQRFCVQDGPGIRTTVFLKGCPLRCAWCHNPESQKARAEILYSPQSCILCGACQKACPKGLHSFSAGEHTFDRASCDGCARCAAACPSGALERCGEEREVGEIIALALRDAEFYKTSGGGFTLSGGEPMAQPDFALALAREARNAHLSVCLETCGFCPREELARILPYVDLFLYDFKLADAEAHKKFTGRDNALILENLSFLGSSGARVVLRCPIIPGVNFTKAHFEAIAEIARTCPGLLSIDLMPYHPLGVDKEKRLGRTPSAAAIRPPDSSLLETFRAWLQNRTNLPVRIS